jgi:hypothetical protein
VRTLRVVSTINLPGLPAGTETTTDPDVPYVAGCLRAGFLIPLEPYVPADALGADAEHELE